MSITFKKQRGVVLPLTLIILAVLTAMASIVILRSDRSIEQATYVRDKWHARLDIHNAEQRLFFAMYGGESQSGGFQLGETLLRTDSAPTRLSNNVWVSLQDADGLVGLTFVDKDRLSKVMRHFYPEPQASNIVSRIIAWQSTTGTTLTATEGPEPRYDLFRSLDELMLIPGISAEDFNGSWTMKGENRLTNCCQFGLRDLVSIRARTSPNLIAMPHVLLKILYGLNDATLARLSRLKRDANWRGVASSLRNMGVPFTSDSQFPGKEYIVRYQSGDIRARGRYEILPYQFPPKRMTWYFPDQYRYFDSRD
ncbi:hypothetical protein [Salinivibrio sp. ES.052]|uniref:hypothetical protein n=1 Tax=Salinivibrio sp. ES.052 TaxID=1882823 RepID=UPI0009260248|nr:hypothetical protein [Salinivibrio sp. ES.052]SIN79555.1 hypothetical protein SAMN05444724_0503 [Salinivibrio sp. ES.052]